MLAEHNYRRRANETAIGLQGVKVQRKVIETGWQNAARRAPRQIGIQRVTIKHAAAMLVNQLLHANARGRQFDTRQLDPPADAERAQPVAPLPTKAAKP